MNHKEVLVINKVVRFVNIDSKKEEIKSEKRLNKIRARKQRKKMDTATKKENEELKKFLQVAAKHENEAMRSNNIAKATFDIAGVTHIRTLLDQFDLLLLKKNVRAQLVIWRDEYHMKVQPSVGVPGEEAESSSDLFDGFESSDGSTGTVDNDASPGVGSGASLGYSSESGTSLVRSHDYYEEFDSDLINILGFVSETRLSDYQRDVSPESAQLLIEHITNP